MFGRAWNIREKTEEEVIERLKKIDCCNENENKRADGKSSSLCLQITSNYNT